MAFQPSEIELKVLRALEQLQDEGCPCGALDGNGRTYNLRMECGVPQIILRAWVDCGDTDWRDTLSSLLRRELIGQVQLPIWPMLGQSCRLSLPDGRVMLIEWQRTVGKSWITFGPTAGPLRPAESTTPAPSVADGESPGMSIMAIAGALEGTVVHGMPRNEWFIFPLRNVYILTKDGAACLDGLDDGSSVQKRALDALKLLIRQQVKAEAKSSLEDDILLAAYRHAGSTRKAAAVLTQELGRTVTKDRVHNAMKRADGAKAVLNTQDSESIQRNVASQRRDRQRKFASPTQPTDLQ